MLGVKKACLDYLKTGFDFPGYLNARAVAMITDEKKKPGTKKMPDKTTSDHPELLSDLKEWRSKKAQDHGLPHYRIAATKVLIAISNNLPRNNRELKQVKGIGPKKLKQYGDELLSIVALYQNSKFPNTTDFE
jgi:superfamily II DNA helicase RecQ